MLKTNPLNSCTNPDTRRLVMYFVKQLFFFVVAMLFAGIQLLWLLADMGKPMEQTVLAQIYALNIAIHVPLPGPMAVLLYLMPMFMVLISVMILARLDRERQNLSPSIPRMSRAAGFFWLMLALLIGCTIAFNKAMDSNFDPVNSLGMSEFTLKIIGLIILVTIGMATLWAFETWLNHLSSQTTPKPLSSSPATAKR